MFKLTELRVVVKDDIIDAKSEIDSIKDLSFEQVSTRAVETCTFVHIVVGDEHIIAHLDKRDLIDKCFDLIRGYVKGRENEAIGFCSHVYNEAANNFSNGLRKICPKSYLELIRHRGDITDWYKKQRVN